MNNLILDNYKRGNVRELTDSEKQELTVLYSATLVFWMIFGLFLYLSYKLSWISRLLIFMPIVIFIINIAVPFKVENSADVKGNTSMVLTFFFVVAGMLINWYCPSKKVDKWRIRRKLFTFIIYSLGFLLLGMLDISIIRNYPLWENHLDMVFNTLSLVMLGTAVIEFFNEVYRQPPK